MATKERNTAVEQKVKYADLIFPDEKAAKNEEKIEAVEDAVINIDNTIAAARKEVRAAAKALALSERTVPFSATRVLNNEYEYENAVENLKRLEAIKERLF